MDRTLFAVFNHDDRDQRVSTPLPLTQTFWTLPTQGRAADPNLHRQAETLRVVGILRPFPSKRLFRVNLQLEN
jgi:hypothetical protein